MNHERTKDENAKETPSAGFFVLSSFVNSVHSLQRRVLEIDGDLENRFREFSIIRLKIHRKSFSLYKPSCIQGYLQFGFFVWLKHFFGRPTNQERTSSTTTPKGNDSKRSVGRVNNAKGVLAGSASWHFAEIVDESERSRFDGFRCLLVFSAFFRRIGGGDLWRCGLDRRRLFCQH